MPSYNVKSYEVVGYTTEDASVYCPPCFKAIGGIDADAWPIFADSEWDYAPVCDRCHSQIEYVTVLQRTYGHWTAGAYTVTEAPFVTDGPDASLGYTCTCGWFRSHCFDPMESIQSHLDVHRMANETPYTPYTGETE